MVSSKRPRTPPPPEPTAAEKALQRRNLRELDKQLEEENRRKKLLVSNKLGTNTLLTGIPDIGSQGPSFAGTQFTARTSAPTAAPVAAPVRATRGRGNIARGR